jgi:hypothetical protein
LSWKSITLEVEVHTSREQVDFKLRKWSTQLSQEGEFRKANGVENMDNPRE